MKKLVIALALSLVAISSLAQNSVLRPRLEIAEVEFETAGTTLNLEIFYMNDESPRMYYLSVGNLGIGSDLIQITFDPIFELFIPLGGTLDEAAQKLQEIKEFYKEPKLSTMELQGCLAAAYPNDKYETVTLTNMRLLGVKTMEFSVKRDDFVRATYISKNDFSSLFSSFKIYRKLHPKQK